MPRCKLCNKEFEKKHYNQIYCSRECQYQVCLDTARSRREKGRKCLICGFDKIVQRHHIVKRIDLGSNDSDNIVDLCPNHHAMADSDRYAATILNLIIKKSNKKGKIMSDEEIKNIENYAKYRFGEYNFWSLRQMINDGSFYDAAKGGSLPYLESLSLRAVPMEQKKAMEKISFE